MTRRRLPLALLAVFAGYLGLTQFVPAADDELYYWCWAKDLQLSYYDHPPLVGWMIAASTAVFGDTLFAVRLPACVASVVMLGVVLRLSPTPALLPGLLLTPVFSLGAVIVTPDTPLLLFWSLYLLWLASALGRLDADGRVPGWLWLAGGLALGLSALGKYTTGLAVPAGFLAFALSRRPWWGWLPGYLLHGLVSLLVFTPVIVFNVHRDFAPLRYQWAHSMANPDPGGLRTFGEFVGVQLLLFGTLPLYLLPWTLRRWRTLRLDPTLRACACLYAPLLLFFLYKSARGPLEGNWALASYVGCWPVAAAWYRTVRPSPTWRRLAAASFLVPAGAVLLATAHLLHPLPLLPPAGDRVTRQGEQLRIVREAAEQARREGLPVYAARYQWVAILRFFGADARQVDGVSRPSHFTTPPRHLWDSDRALVFGDDYLPAAETAGFGPPAVLTFFPLVVRGEQVGAFSLLRYEKRLPQPVN